MNTRTILAAFAAVLALLTPALRAQVPQLINYQGRIAVGAVNFDGSGQFKFAIVNAAGNTTFWSNDGTSVAGSQPTAAVSLTVTKGLYSVLLGDTTLANMSAIPVGEGGNNNDVRLRVWFNDGTHGSQLLSPDQHFASVLYAIVAGTVVPGAIGTNQLASNLSLNGDLNLTSGSIVLQADGINRSINADSDGIIIDGVSVSTAHGIRLPTPSGGGHSIIADNNGISTDGNFTVSGTMSMVGVGASLAVVGPTPTFTFHAQTYVAQKGLGFQSHGNGLAEFITGNTWTIINPGQPTETLIDNGATGVAISPGSGAWSSLSDRNSKANVTNVDARTILRHLVSIPIARWNYKSQDAAIRHIGPMAQDFYAAFSVGEDSKHISTIDADGVSLAAIQGLNSIVEEKEAEIADLKKRVADLEKAVSALVQPTGGTP